MQVGVCHSGWGVSRRGGVCHTGVGWVGHAGLGLGGWGGPCKGGVCHAGLDCVIVRKGCSGRPRIEVRGTKLFFGQSCQQSKAKSCK